MVPSLLLNSDPVLRRGWHPVVRSDDLLAEPQDVELVGEHWELCRSADGPLVVRGRQPWGLTERSGLVWLAPEQPVAELMDLPEAEDPRFASTWLPTFDTSAPAGLYLDNQVDVAHFPFVHSGTFGSAASTLVDDFEVFETAEGFTATMAHGFRNLADPGVAEGLRPVEQVRRLTYRFRLPMQLQLLIDHEQTGQRTVLLFGTLPRADGRTRLWLRVLRDDVPGFPGSAVQSLPETVAFETRVVLEDLALQEKFDVPGLPMEARMEVAVRADRTNLVLRKLLRTLWTQPVAA